MDNKASIVVAVSLIDRHGTTLVATEVLIPLNESERIVVGKVIDAAQRGVANAVEVIAHQHPFNK